MSLRTLMTSVITKPNKVAIIGRYSITDQILWNMHILKRCLLDLKVIFSIMIKLVLQWFNRPTMGYDFCCCWRSSHPVWRELKAGKYLICYTIKFLKIIFTNYVESTVLPTGTIVHT